MGDIKRKATFEKLFKEAVPNSEGKIWFQHPTKMHSERKICFMLNGKEVKFMMYMTTDRITLWAEHFKEFVQTGQFDNNFYCRFTNADPMISKKIHKFPFTKLGHNNFYAHNQEAMKILTQIRESHGDTGLELVGKPPRPRTKLVCTKCGSDNVHVKAWVNANSNKYVSEATDGNIDDFWCADCEENHKLTMIDVT